MSKTGAFVAAFLALCVIAVAVYLWKSLGNVDMGVAGYIALIAGGLAAFALGAGLMMLLFYSNRAGYDEGAAHPVRDDENAGEGNEPS